MTKTLTPDEALQLIRAHIDAAGSRKEIAQQHGLSMSTVNKVYVGTRSAPTSLLESLGLQRVTTYTKTE